MVYMMERNLVWKPLTKAFASTLCLLIFLLPVQGQNWELLSTHSLKSPVRITSIDRLSNIYLSDNRGNVFKVDSLGRVLAQYAPAEYGQLTALEAWSSLRVFLFYHDTQRYTFLDRFLSPNEFSEFPKDVLGLVAQACPSSDNQVWVLDLTAFSLTKFDIRFNSVSLSQPLNQLADTLTLEPYQLVEYQNRVYLGDTEIGILVFDNLGNYLHTIEKQGSSAFHFQNEQTYYLSEDQLHIKGLYREQNLVIELPVKNHSFDHAVKLNSSILLISDHKLEFYHYSPR